MSDRKSFAKELATQEVRGSTLRIPKGGKVPRALIRNIVKMRTKTNASKEKPKTRK